MAASVQEGELIWVPQSGPQESLLSCPAFEVLFGGARGGGKSDAILGDWCKHSGEYGEAARGIMVRREATQLEDIIARSHQLYRRLGWDWNGTVKTWTSPGRSILRFRHLWDVTAAESYQGHSYSRLYPEELTNWPDEKPLLRMIATVRSAHGVRVGVRATANPGGPGHNWVKSRYIDPAPPMTPIIDPKTGETRVFIPSLLSDNPILAQSDPGYANRLRDLGSEELVRAWLEGDWNIVAGGALDDVWSAAKHVVPPFQIPAGWRIDRSFDWGSSKPFSVGWWAESNGEEVEVAGVKRAFAPKSLIRIAELYGWNGKANEGSRKIATEVAREVLAAEMAMGLRGRVRPGPADAAIFAVENGTSIASDMERVGVRWEPSEKGPGSRANGLERVRQYLKASLASPQESPGLFFFDTCRHAIRTLPTLPRDSRKTDDVDTDAEDHVFDETRYRVMAANLRATAISSVGIFGA
jgi:hypothetical protein